MLFLQTAAFARTTRRAYRRPSHFSMSQRLQEGAFERSVPRTMQEVRRPSHRISCDGGLACRRTRRVARFPAPCQGVRPTEFNVRFKLGAEPPQFGLQLQDHLGWHSRKATCRRLDDAIALSRQGQMLPWIGRIGGKGQWARPNRSQVCLRRSVASSISHHSDATQQCMHGLTCRNLCRTVAPHVVPARRPAGGAER